MEISENLIKRQIIPITLAACVAVLLAFLLLGEIAILNRFTTADISTRVRIGDIVLGMTIYLKTSIDFALFMGNLMKHNRGWKNRISIELGTALGNALGTGIVLAVWAFFKEVTWLLAIMIVVASLVLFKLAESGLEHTERDDRRWPRTVKLLVNGFEYFLDRLNRIIAPFIRYILPEFNMNAGARAGFWSLFGFAVSVPFFLGLDDFAGYVPIFSLVNVFGFSIGVFLAHALLNMFLYLSPERTVKVVKNPFISFFGSVIFVGLGIWGLIEAARLIAHFA